ncbi:MAG: hypothetical protein QM730_12315 [Anaerolineales bacterium]
MTSDNSSNIVLDNNGNIYITGESYASWGENPIHAFTGDINTNKSDVFVAKLDTNGTVLWNTFLGGNAFDSPGGMALGENGDIYITGRSQTDWGNTVSDPLNPFSGDFPNSNGFIAKLAPSGELQWHTFFGASASGNEIVIGKNGSIYIAGGSEATWGNSPIRSFSGEGDGFVAKLSSTGDLLWNTFLGGSAYDAAWSLTTDTTDNILVTGYASSSWGNNPIHPYTGFADSFLAKLDANGNLVWNTFFGGSGFDHATDVVVNNADQTVVVIGSSENAWGDSPLFPYNADGKYFLAQFHPEGDMQWTAFFGENKYRILAQNSLALRNGSIYATGYSANSWGAPVHDHNTSNDAYVLKVKLGNTSSLPPTSTPVTPTVTNTPITPTVTETPSPTPSDTPTPRRPFLKSSALSPTSLTSQFGTTSGSPSCLNLFDQSGTQDNPDAYVSFQTLEDTFYLGYQSFTLPEDAQAKLVSTMLLQVNFKAPASPHQVWTWSIYNWSTGMWIPIGDTVGTTPDEWQTLLFHIRQPRRYISAAGEIRIQLLSENTGGAVKIDYQALHITYLSFPATATPEAPLITSDRPSIFSVPSTPKP